MLTISEVAKIAGVSVATISRVLNNSPLVSEKTRSRVRGGIKDLDYHPGGGGQNLSSSKSRILLALVPNISNPFHAEIVHGINKIVYARGYNLLLCETHGIREREDAFFNMLKQKIVDGMLAIDPAVSADNLRKYGASFPIIQCCESKDGVDLPYVGVNDEAGAYAAVSHLIATGCRQIAMANASGPFGFARQRRAGYLRALQAHGLTPDSAMVIEYNMGEDSGEMVARRLMDLPRRPDGIFFDYDVVAVGAQRVLIEAGWRVPEDVAIVGFDGSDMTLICTPTLTTVAQPAYEIGLKAAEMLFALLEGRTLAEKRVTLDFALKIRQSTH